jgi:hypothetical protein
MHSFTMRIQSTNRANNTYLLLQQTPPSSQPTAAATTAMMTTATTTSSSSYGARRARKRAYALILPQESGTAAARNDELLFSAAVGGLQVDRQRAKWALLDRHAALPACARVAFANALFDEPLDELDFGRMSRRLVTVSSQCLVRYYFGDFMRDCRAKDAFVEMVEVTRSELVVEFRLPCDCNADKDDDDEEVLGANRRMWLRANTTEGLAYVTLVLADSPGREVLRRCPLPRTRTRFGLARIALGGIEWAARGGMIALCLELEPGGGGSPAAAMSLGRLGRNRAGAWVVSSLL